MYYEITTFPNFCPCCGYEFKIFWIKKFKKGFKSYSLIKCPLCQTGFRKLDKATDKIGSALIVPDPLNLDK